ncbi:MAG: YgfZ/GcvT domain-containing protein [Steroidobacterales bacterium]
MNPGKTAMNERSECGRFDDLGLLRFQGSEASKFLQGQLSQDLNRLGAAGAQRTEQGLLAGLHNPQGRTIAVLRLAPLSSDEIAAVLPLELADPVAAQLRRYVLRAKVTIVNDSSNTGVYGFAGALAHLPAGVASLRIGSEHRWLVLAPTQGLQLPHGDPTVPRAAWRAADIAAGLPQVYAATSGAFVAQMLNLDCVDAVSFSKGCYTGQEVIARAHYRGRVKRRMQRFKTRSPQNLAAGDSGTLQDGRSFQVVDAVRDEAGRSEFLAVAALTAAATDTADAAPVGATIDCDALPLPYDLPG